MRSQTFCTPSLTTLAICTAVSGHVYVFVVVLERAYSQIWSRREGDVCIGDRVRPLCTQRAYLADDRGSGRLFCRNRFDGYRHILRRYVCVMCLRHTITPDLICASTIKGAAAVREGAITEAVVVREVLYSKRHHIGLFRIERKRCMTYGEAGAYCGCGHSMHVCARNGEGDSIYVNARSWAQEWPRCVHRRHRQRDDVGGAGCIMGM